jgi:hypothetical protein
MMMKLTARLNGSGNMFAPDHFPKAQATRFKKELAARLALRMKLQRLTLKSSAIKAGCDVEAIRNIREAKVADFDISELVGLARKFGFGVRIDVSVPGLPQLH